MSNEYELKTENDFNGNVSLIIKLMKAIEKAGVSSKDTINLMENSNKSEILKQINERLFNKTIEQKESENLRAQEDRAKDFGIGDYSVVEEKEKKKKKKK